MKVKLFFILLTFGIVAAVSAQGWGHDFGRPNHPEGNRAPRYPNRPQMNMPAAETVTVTGSLVVAHGSPALKSGDDTYLLAGVNCLVGFIDGFKEGAQVTMEGYTVTFPRDNNLKFLRPSKLTINGKTYDMAFDPRREFPENNLHRRGMPIPPQGFPRQPAPQSRRHHGHYL